MARKRTMKMQNLLRNAAGVTAIGKHSLKGRSPSGLTQEGESKARWAGRNLPKGFVAVARAGELPRQQSTANVMFYAYRGQRSGGVQTASELGFKHLKEMGVTEKLIEQKGDARVLADWIDGKISATVMENPEKVGLEILRGSIPETFRHIKEGERPFAINLTSSWFDAAVLKALGIDYRSIKPKKGMAKQKPMQGESLKETEAMLFFHMPDGRAILAFRGRRFDVTEKLQKILG